MGTVASNVNWATLDQAAVAGGVQAATSAATGSDKLASEDTFLKLFVAQLKNQDPTNPADGMQFVTQLAQFTQLEQLMNIRKDLDSIQTSVQIPDGSQGTGSSSDTNGSA